MALASSAIGTMRPCKGRCCSTVKNLVIVKIIVLVLIIVIAVVAVIGWWRCRRRVTA